MKSGYLSEYFEGVAAKKLSAVEADETRSNQHEYHATKAMQAFLCSPLDPSTLPTRFLYISDDETDPTAEDAYLTLYNCRKGKPRAPEYHLYFPTTAVSKKANEGDLLVIAKKRDGGLLVIIAEKDSSVGLQIQWLFGFSDLARPGFSVKSELDAERDRIEFTSRFILENIGIAVEAPEATHLDEMLDRFSGKFPTTRIFSAFARSTLSNVSARDQPDMVLMAWMEREEVLFRALERHLIADRLSKGFGAGTDPGGLDVDGFLTFSLSVQNRRKSRVGLALENHLELLFAENALRFSRTAVTENKSKPDFIFPGIDEYRNPNFDSVNLTMLGVKSTCKDRWRQVLAEADRIDQKHLLTLEPAISSSQTNEMSSKRLQLVLPRSLHQTYTISQQKSLMDIEGFMNVARERQKYRTLSI